MSAAATPRTGRGRRYGRTRSRTGRLLQLGLFALSFVLVAGLVVTSSRAAFVAQSDNSANQVSSASIELTDNDSDGAMFNLPGVLPAVSYERCVDVSYAGNVDPTAVRLYASAAPGGDLAPYLDLTIEIGAATGATFSGCGSSFTATGTVYSGTLADFAANRGSYASPAATTAWDPVGPESRAFRFTVSVQNVPAAENKSTTFGFTWETRTS